MGIVLDHPEQFGLPERGQRRRAPGGRTTRNGRETAGQVAVEDAQHPIVTALDEGGNLIGRPALLDPEQSWSAEESPPPPPIQNRACEFPRTRLLDHPVFVTDT